MGCRGIRLPDIVNSRSTGKPEYIIAAAEKKKAGKRSVRTAVGSQKDFILLPYIRLGNIVKALVVEITLVMVLSLIVLHYHTFVA